MAHALIEALKELACERGVRSICLLANAGNEPAMKLYAATLLDDDVMWMYDL